MQKQGLRFAIHKRFYKLGYCEVVICLQFATPLFEKSINVLVSVSNNEKIDVYLARNNFVYKKRTKAKTPTILVVTQGIIKLKSQCWKKTLRLNDSLRTREKGFFTNL